MRHNSSGRLIAGLILIALGISFFIDQLGIKFIPFSLWPMVLILIGLVVLLVQRNTTGGIIISGIGAMFLISEVFNVNAFSVMWPLIIILVGIAILFKPRQYSNWSKNETANTSSDYINESIVFGALNKKIVSKDFKGGKIESVFGGFKLDLSEIVVKDTAELQIESVFGGGEIILPKDIKVNFGGSSVFGGWDNKTTNSENDKPVITISGSCVFGGVEVKNL